MRLIRYVIGLLGVIFCITACHYPASFPLQKGKGADSLYLNTPRLYALNSNFEVTADSLWLYQLPFTDSVDPISKCIHWFSNTHTVVFFIIVGLFFLWTVLKAVRKKQIKLLGLNDIDSVFPIVLSWLLSSSAVLYNSILHFVPQTWMQYYYNPTLNPFELPFILGLFIVWVGMIGLVGIAMLDDLFHQPTLEISFFYLVGFISCCIFLYIFFTYIWVYLAYLCWISYTVLCVTRLRKSNSYPYACGACGAKMRAKGICPHCGALNQ